MGKAIEITDEQFRQLKRLSETLESGLLSEFRKQPYERDDAKADTDRANAERFNRIEAILLDHSRIPKPRKTGNG